MSSSAPSFSKLNGSNYATWAGDMEAWLKAQALWHIANGTSKCLSLEAENADTKPLDESITILKPAQRVRYRQDRRLLRSCGTCKTLPISINWALLPSITGSKTTEPIPTE
ncbi:hypothetical protein MD484_g8874, partial [Candolleomyces efflorescens]